MKQKEMSVKPFTNTDVPAPEPLSKGEETFELAANIILFACPFTLGLAGHYYFGPNGAVVGILIGCSPWIFAGVI